jgi:hypothetical protein
VAVVSWWDDALEFLPVGSAVAGSNGSLLACGRKLRDQMRP